MNTEVILKEDYPSLGYVGDKVSVRAGYARNFLVPRGLAVEARSRNAKMLNHAVAHILVKKAKLKSAAEELQKRLEAVELECVLKGGEGGRTFGSISARDILTLLAEKGFTLDRSQVRLLETMKKPGSYKVQVKLHADVSAQVSVKISVAQEAVKAVSGDERKPRRARRKSPEEGAVEGQATAQATAQGAETSAGEGAAGKGKAASSGPDSPVH